MKVCFIGLGSIAKRHIENLLDIIGKHDLRIDAFRRDNSTEMESNIKEVITNIYTKVEQMQDDYDIIFITNPTQEHKKSIEVFQNYTKALFIEKPVFNKAKSNKELYEYNLRADVIFYVACPLRYTNVVQYVKQHIMPKEVYSIRSISSSFLPDWRPGIDYRKTYSAHKNLGGGVALDLIHEWDYLVYLFGLPKQVMCMKGNVSDLEIDSEDYAIYMGKYDDKIVELHLDYWGRKTIRRFELYMREETVICDLLEGKITYLNENKIIELAEERNEFQKRELINFLEICQSKKENENDIEHANKILSLVEGKTVETT